MIKITIHFQTLLIILGATILNPCFANLLIVPDSFKTISSALKAAHHNDTIYIKKGTYNESLQLLKAVSILGESRDSSIIYPAGAIGIDCIGGYRGAFIKKIRIEGGKIGIRTQMCSPTIEGNLIVNTSSAGVQSFGYCPEIRNNVIYGSKISGIYFEKVRSNSHLVSNNVIMNSCYAGIHLAGTNSINLNGNIIDSSKYGIYCNNSCKIDFKGSNVISNCKYLIESTDFELGHIIFQVPSFISPGFPDFNYHTTPDSVFNKEYPDMGIQNEY